MLVPKDNLINAEVEKGKIIHSNIYRILLIVNQVIYTLNTICEPIIMTLAQAVLQIFCSQAPLWVKCLSPKREIIQSNFDSILRGLFGKFVEVGHKIFQYLYNPFFF